MTRAKTFVAAATRADQPGDGYWNVASPVSRSFKVT